MNQIANSEPRVDRPDGEGPSNVDRDGHRRMREKDDPVTYLLSDPSTASDGRTVRDRFGP